MWKPTSARRQGATGRAYGHGSSLRITNKKIENDMKKFFADDKIKAFNKETEKMIEEEEKNKKESSSKKDDASSTETPSASKTDEDASKAKKDATPKRRGRKPKGGKA